VFTARYALSPYIKQMRFVFMGKPQSPNSCVATGSNRLCKPGCVYEGAAVFCSGLQFVTAVCAADGVITACVKLRTVYCRSEHAVLEVKGKSCPCNVMRTHRQSGCVASLISFALDGGNRSASRFGRLTSGKVPSVLIE
jgi:hypothetical protein